MNFKLKTPKIQSSSLILFYVNLPGGRRFVYSTGQKIPVRLWDSHAQLPKKSISKRLLKDNDFPVEISSLKPRKQTEILHKPIEDVKSLLEEIKEYNFNLFLCCSLTYGCLLRPHREIRLLKWKDFSDDLKYISIDGARVKSKRNRVVPVPEFIRTDLLPIDKEFNIFSRSTIDYNPDYFKTLWSRFKKQSRLIKDEQTMYSFRHSGAIDIFKRTGCITKLQKAMGHSSINVSLTYLRGLEIPELNEEDMPMI